MLSQGIVQCKNEFTKQRALFDQCSFVLALSQHSEVMAEKALGRWYELTRSFKDIEARGVEDSSTRICMKATMFVVMDKSEEAFALFQKEQEGMEMNQSAAEIWLLSGVLSNQPDDTLQAVEVVLNRFCDTAQSIVGCLFLAKKDMITHEVTSALTHLKQAISLHASTVASDMLHSAYLKTFYIESLLFLASLYRDPLQDTERALK